jgi:hypothetical protein
LPTFFNVVPVHDYLIEKGYVYTLRKKRTRLGVQNAVKGKLFHYDIFAKIDLEEIGEIIKPEQLREYHKDSGLVGWCSVKEWFELGKKLSKTENPYLYKATLIERVE